MWKCSPVQSRTTGKVERKWNGVAERARPNGQLQNHPEIAGSARLGPARSWEFHNTAIVRWNGVETASILEATRPKRAVRAERAREEHIGGAESTFEKAHGKHNRDTVTPIRGAGNAEDATLAGIYRA